MPRISDVLVRKLRTTAAYNPDAQVAPACILWPDHDRQWEAAIPRVREDVPELLVLGDYNPQERTGPAIWLLCAIAKTLADVSLPDDRVPILYLPDVSRQDLRAVEACPDNLKPLAELQYRGVIWSQVNAKDWTILAFLKSDQGGLDMDVAQDADTRNAMQLAISYLMDEKVESLSGKHLDKDYFNALLTSGDTMRDILRWLDNPDEFRHGRGEKEWRAFVELGKSQLAFDPQKEGLLAGATKLAGHEAPWQAVWERYCEAPKRYPNIPSQIRKCQPPTKTWQFLEGANDGWPQWNEEREESLRQELIALSSVPEHQARQRILELEKQHARRRQLVWTELGESRLAQALEFLAVLAEITKSGLAAGSVEDLASGYQGHGWRADDAVIRSLAVVEGSQQLEAVVAAIRAVYYPWAEDSARHLQKTVADSAYPGGAIGTTKTGVYENGACVVFVDGLRFDAAKRLVESLSKRACKVEKNIRWAALPSLTSTGKAAVAPVRDSIRGADRSADFEPCVAETGQSLKGGYHFGKLLSDEGWQILERSDNGDGHGKAWTESSDIDHEGHDRGWKLAKQLDVLLGEIVDRILALLSAGWTTVRVVTDHGWLLLPGGLPKIDLPAALTENKWGRCAAIKPGATTAERLYPWFWNPSQHFALADGISCFRKGEEYSHGGLSLQECLTLELTVSKPSAPGLAASVQFADIVWKGMRCAVIVDGDSSGLSLDIRLEPGDPSSSVTVSTKPLKEDGTASVVVEDEDIAGRHASLVLLNSSDEIEAKVETVIAGGKSDGA